MSALRQTAVFPVAGRNALAGYSVKRSRATGARLVPQASQTSGLRLSPHTSATTQGEGIVLVLDEAVERLDEKASRNYVSQLWAEDWDSPEDSVYDTW